MRKHRMGGAIGTGHRLAVVTVNVLVRIKGFLEGMIDESGGARCRRTRRTRRKRW